MSLRTILAGSGAGLLNAVSAFASNVWLIGLAGRTIEKDLLGLFFSITTLASYFGLLQLSLDFAASQTVAERLAVGDRDGAARAIRQTAVVNRVLIAIIVAVMAVVAWLVPIYLERPDRIAMVRTILAVVAGTQIATCLARPYIAALTGSNRYAATQLLRVGASLIATGVGLLLLYAGSGVVALAAVDAVLQVSLLAFLMRTAHRQCDWIGRSTAQPWLGFRAMVTYSLGITFATILDSASIFCDLGMIRLAEKPVETMADYAIWWRLPLLFHSMTYILLNASSPTVIAAYARSEDEGRSTFRRVFGLFVAVTLAGMVGIALWLSPVVRAWQDGHYDLPRGAEIGVGLAIAIGARNLFVGQSLPFFARTETRPIHAAHVVRSGMKLSVWAAFGCTTTIPILAAADAAAAVAAMAVLGFVLVRRGEFSITMPWAILVALAAVGAVGWVLAPFLESWRGSTLAAGIGLSGLVLGSLLALAVRVLR
jgi:hypothetical protein